MSEFDYKIKHRPGRVHANADTLSRIPVAVIEDQEQPVVELDNSKIKLEHNNDSWCRTMVDYLRRQDLWRIVIKF